MYFIPDNSKIVSLLYEDTMNIYRWSDIKDSNNITRPGLSFIGTEKCGLSFKNNYNLELNNPGQDVSTEPIIFSLDSVDLKDGDILSVTTRHGKVYNLKCGEPLYYGGSHVQVTCVRYEDEIEV